MNYAFLCTDYLIMNVLNGAQGGMLPFMAKVLHVRLSGQRKLTNCE